MKYEVQDWGKEKFAAKLRKLGTLTRRPITDDHINTLWGLLKKEHPADILTAFAKVAESEWDNPTYGNIIKHLREATSARIESEAWAIKEEYKVGLNKILAPANDYERPPEILEFLRRMGVTPREDRMAQ